MRYIGVIAILLLVFTIGCGPTIIEGKRIDAAKRSQIIKGQTTAAEVVGIWGQPAKIEKLPSGAEKYVYQYYKEEYSHWWTLPKYERQKMEVIIDNGIVHDYRYQVDTRGVITDKDE